MKQTVLTKVLLILTCIFATACSRQESLRLLPVTHVAVGRTATLVAYVAYHPFNLPFSRGQDNQETARRLIEPAWTVSDSSVASVAEDGRLTGIKPGTIMLRAAWEGQEVSSPVVIEDNLALDSLPQLTEQELTSGTREVRLGLSADRLVRFRLSFDDPGQDLMIEAKAGDQQLPWRFNSEQGSLELTSAQGRVIHGEARPKRGGRVAFTVWSDDAGVYPVSLTGKVVLLAGDSMADGLGLYLRDKVQAAGGRLISEAWTSSSTIGWRGSGRMRELVERYHPDIVFMALGSNELLVPNIESRGEAIREIEKQMGDRPAYWIGPPSWKPDKGIVHVIEQNVHPGHFYNSNDLKVPRRKDGAHPTAEGFKTWANLIWDWYGATG